MQTNSNHNNNNKWINHLEQKVTVSREAINQINLLPLRQFHPQPQLNLHQLLNPLRIVTHQSLERVVVVNKTTSLLLYQRLHRQKNNHKKTILNTNNQSNNLKSAIHHNVDRGLDKISKTNNNHNRHNKIPHSSHNKDKEEERHLELHNLLYQREEDLQWIQTRLSIVSRLF